MTSLRNVCFTINNYTVDELESVKQIGLPLTYIVIGYEVGESGTKHLQGYAEFNKLIKFNTVKKMIGERAHIESRRGTQKQADDYCKKDGDWWTKGELKKQGERGDLDIVRTEALEGGMREVTTKRNMQQMRIAEKFLTYNEEPRDWKPTVYWIWGTTGTGKSRKAREITENMDTYTKNDGTKWWEGYDGHDAVIIDDFRPSWWSLTEMLSILDRYEKRVEYKGGLRQLRAHTIIITSALKPEDCYKNTGESIDQLLRRIDHVEEMVTEVTEVGGVILDPPQDKRYHR